MGAMWTLIEYAAWAASAVLLLWMLLDATRIGRDFGEDVLLSSREGEIDIELDGGDGGGPDRAGGR